MNYEHIRDEWSEYCKNLEQLNDDMHIEKTLDNAWDEPEVDMVNHPSHYTNGKVEVIEVIEDAVSSAPNPTAGMLQGQVLKYILRLWLKGNSIQDARKAQWYLERLIDKLNKQ